jgi:hypothetical protein
MAPFKKFEEFLRRRYRRYFEKLVRFNQIKISERITTSLKRLKRKFYNVNVIPGIFHNQVQVLCGNKEEIFLLYLPEVSKRNFP